MDSKEKKSANSVLFLASLAGFAVGVIVASFAVAGDNKEQIQVKMNAAVQSEEYELAARYRDQLKRLNS